MVLCPLIQLLKLIKYQDNHTTKQKSNKRDCQISVDPWQNLGKVDPLTIYYFKFTEWPQAI